MLACCKTQTGIIKNENTELEIFVLGMYTLHITALYTLLLYTKIYMIDSFTCPWKRSLDLEIR